MFFLLCCSFTRGSSNHIIERIPRQVPDPDSESIPQQDLGSTFALEAEIAKRIRQGETSNLSPAETGTVLKGLATSLDPLGLGATLARRKVVNDILGGTVPLDDDRNQLIKEIYGLNDPVLTLQDEKRTALQEILNDPVVALQEERKKALQEILTDPLLTLQTGRRKALLDILNNSVLTLQEERRRSLQEILTDPILTLQEERRNALRKLYGVNFLTGTTDADILGLLASDRRGLINRISGLDTLSLAAERRLIRRLILERRLANFRNSLARPLGFRNPYIVRDIIGR